MTTAGKEQRQVHGFCGLCIARCGTIATVENGRFTRLDPDPSHPTGAAICAAYRPRWVRAFTNPSCTASRASASFPSSR